MKIKELVKKYVECEKEIQDALAQLDNYDDDCDCENPELIRTIFEGEYPEIMNNCINCGGLL